MNSNNGSNNFDVSFGDISYLGNRILLNHRNISNIRRTHDILFTINRINQRDTLKIVCLREYIMGLDKVLEVLSTFREVGQDVNIIYIGGGWNKYTSEAKSYCINNQIGLFVTDEMTGALFANQYWNYHKRDKDGNPIYFGGTPL